MKGIKGLDGLKGRKRATPLIKSNQTNQIDHENRPQIQRWPQK
jgi:hypothetical protein